jgi:hypothetical protein
VLQLTVGFDAVRTHQEQQIRRGVGRTGNAGLFGALPGDASLHLAAHVVGRVVDRVSADEIFAGENGHGPALGMKNHSLSGAFDIDWPAILAAPAVIGHHGKGVLLFLAGRLEVFQRLLHLQQIERHAPERLARLLRLRLGLAGSRAQRCQQAFFGLEPAVLTLDLVTQIRAGILLVAQAGGDLAEFFAHRPHLNGQLHLLLRQFRMQRLPFLFVGRFHLLSLLFRFRPAGGLGLRTFLGQPCRFAQRPGLGGLVGLAVHHEQDEDQRPHGAEQHGQEGERRDLQLVPTCSHAAFPGCMRGWGGAADGGKPPAARAVSR